MSSFINLPPFNDDDGTIGHWTNKDLGMRHADIDAVDTCTVFAINPDGSEGQEVGVEIYIRDLGVYVIGGMDLRNKVQPFIDEVCIAGIIETVMGHVLDAMSDDPVWALKVIKDLQRQSYIQGWGNCLEEVRKTLPSPLRD